MLFPNTHTTTKLFTRGTNEREQNRSRIEDVRVLAAAVVDDRRVGEADDGALAEPLVAQLAQVLVLHVELVLLFGDAQLVHLQVKRKCQIVGDLELALLVQDRVEHLFQELDKVAALDRVGRYNVQRHAAVDLARVLVQQVGRRAYPYLVVVRVQVNLEQVVEDFRVVLEVRVVVDVVAVAFGVFGSVQGLDVDADGFRVFAGLAYRWKRLYFGRSKRFLKTALPSKMAFSSPSSLN